MEGRDEVVDAFEMASLHSSPLTCTEGRQLLLSLPSVGIGLDDLTMTHGNACQRMHTDEEREFSEP